MWIYLPSTYYQSVQEVECLTSDCDNWRSFLEQDKTIEPAIFRMVDGLDTRLDTSIYSNRKERLRVVGNGVIPIVAAYAFCVLYDKIRR